MSPQRCFFALLKEQPLQKGDVIFVLQGDGLNRAPYAVDLFMRGFAPLIVIVGNANDRSYGSFPSDEVCAEMKRLGLSDAALLSEQVAPHTRAEAERAMQLARERRWIRLLIVTSPHHQYRAFLTFLKAMRDAGLELTLINAVAPLSLIEENPWGRREDLLADEFAKIELYGNKGDVASYEEGITYLKSL